MCSPLHGLEKQKWTEKLVGKVMIIHVYNPMSYTNSVDPKASGLRIPTAVPPRIIDYPCTWQSSIKDVLKKLEKSVAIHNCS